MPLPTTPIYLVIAEVERIRRSDAFRKDDKLRDILGFVVGQTLDAIKITQTSIAKYVWPAETIRKNNVRTHVSRLRIALAAYYANSIDSGLVISLPQAGVNAASDTVMHYTAQISFNPALSSPEVFAAAMNAKYNLPVDLGKRWFSAGIEPMPHLLRALLVEEKKRAILIDSLNALNSYYLNMYDLFESILAWLELKWPNPLLAPLCQPLYFGFGYILDLHAEDVLKSRMLNRAEQYALADPKPPIQKPFTKITYQRFSQLVHTIHDRHMAAFDGIKKAVDDIELIFNTLPPDMLSDLFNVPPPPNSRHKKSPAPQASEAGGRG